MLFVLPAIIIGGLILFAITPVLTTLFVLAFIGTTCFIKYSRSDKSNGK